MTLKPETKRPSKLARFLRCPSKSGVPTRNLASAALTVLAVEAFTVAAAADDAEVQYGAYVCVTDRTVGLQGPRDGPDRFAGKIKPAADHEKFFVTIRKIEAGSRLPFSGEWIRHDPDWCKRAMKYLQSDWESGGSPLGASLFEKGCLATSQVEIKTGDTAFSYFAVGKNAFVDGWLQRFWITNGWRFQWNYLDFEGGAYLSEGRCDLVK